MLPLTFCLCEIRYVFKNVGKKSQEKKSRKKSHRFGYEKVTGKKVTKIKTFFPYFMLKMDIIIFIITNIIKNILFGLMFYVLIINFQLCRDGANVS